MLSRAVLADRYHRKPALKREKDMLRRTAMKRGLERRQRSRRDGAYKNRIYVKKLITTLFLVLTCFTTDVADTRYNNDRRTDIACYNPRGDWGAVPRLFPNGAGSWNPVTVF